MQNLKGVTVMHKVFWLFMI